LLKDDDVGNLVYSRFVSLRNDIVQRRPNRVLSHGSNLIEDEEFLKLYDLFEPRNPDFPHEA